ncbi:MAG: hypothetical protein R2730_07090 [Chitinophagales bacterium]
MRTLSLFAIILLINTISIYSVKAQTNIYDIQYVDPSSNSDISPYVNQTVTVRGVVTATKESGQFRLLFHSTDRPVGMGRYSIGLFYCFISC